MDFHNKKSLKRIILYYYKKITTNIRKEITKATSPSELPPKVHAMWGQYQAPFDRTCIVNELHFDVLSITEIEISRSCGLMQKRSRCWMALRVSLNKLTVNDSTRRRLADVWYTTTWCSCPFYFLFMPCMYGIPSSACSMLSYKNRRDDESIKKKKQMAKSETFSWNWNLEDIAVNVLFVVSLQIILRFLLKKFSIWHKKKKYEINCKDFTKKKFKFLITGYFIY